MSSLLNGWHTSRCLRLVIVVLAWAQVDATSSGVAVDGFEPCYDAVKLCTMPCPDGTDGSLRKWATDRGDGTFGPCCPPGMDKVAPPTKSAAYAITADVAKYRPCELVELKVVVKSRCLSRPRIPIAARRCALCTRAAERPPRACDG